MKVLPFKIPKHKKASFVFQIDKESVFYDKLHQHEEIQFSYIVKGSGTLVVGDTVNYYSKGDVLVIGSNLPHVFKSDRYIEEVSHMLSLFFTKDSFGKEFFELEELKSLQHFFKLSSHGFKVTSNKDSFESLFLKLEDASSLERFLILIQLMNLIPSANSQSLSSFIYNKRYSAIEGNRMRNVFEYTMDHFHKTITLTDIAEIANMTQNAFCKYFKKRTNKTYMQFLNELRIESACKALIANKELTVVEIAELSGFNNLSNFNRQFKTLKKISPSEFRKYSN